MSTSASQWKFFLCVCETFYYIYCKKFNYTSAISGWKWIVIQAILLLLDKKSICLANSLRKNHLYVLDNRNKVYIIRKRIKLLLCCIYSIVIAREPEEDNCCTKKTSSWSKAIFSRILGFLHLRLAKFRLPRNISWKWQS